jgi:peptidyl-prolyl cis-trans isomerase D
MLDFMRRHAQSWMIKVALGAVVVVFVFWGIWNPHEGRERDLVKIDGQTISIVEAKNYYQRLRENYQSIYREMFTEEMVKKMGLKERAVRDLVNKVLLLQEAHRLGMTATPGEVQAAIQDIPAFQKNGAFDQATYLRALQGARLNAKEFEANQKQMLLLSKIQRLIVSSAKVSDPEVLDYYRAIFEKVNLEVLSLDPADIRDVSVTPDEVKGYFAKHREDFKTLARVRAQYLLFDPKDFEKQIQITPKETADYYQNNREKYTQPKRIKVRHILIKAEAKETEASAKARKKAESIREEAVKGKDFAQLVKQYSEDPGTKDRGGDLGYLSRGQLVPEFEQEAFSLKVGEIGKVVQTPYGFHILRVDEIQEAKVEPLEKVKDQIASFLRARKTRELAHDDADQAYASSSKGKGLDSFAKERNLKLKETGLFSINDKTALDPKLRDAALSLNKGEVSPVLRLGETFAVLQVLERHEPRTPELKEVEGQVSEALKREKQKEKALAKANEVLEKLRKGAEVKSLAAQERFRVEETGFFDRGNDPPKMGNSEELRKAVATLGLKSPYPENPIFLDGKYLIVHLKEKKDVDLAQFNSQKENYRLGVLQQKQELLLTQYQDDLLEQAKAKGNYKMIREVNEVL